MPTLISRLYKRVVSIDFLLLEREKDGGWNGEGGGRTLPRLQRRSNRLRRSLVYCGLLNWT